jgi:hypothetical protein
MDMVFRQQRMAGCDFGLSAPLRTKSVSRKLSPHFLPDIKTTKPILN